MKITLSIAADVSTDAAPAFDLMRGDVPPGVSPEKAHAELRAIAPKGTGRLHAADATLTREEARAEVVRLRGLGHEVRIPPSARRLLGEV